MNKREDKCEESTAEMNTVSMEMMDTNEMRMLNAAHMAEEVNDVNTPNLTPA